MLYFDQACDYVGQFLHTTAESGKPASDRIEKAINHLTKTGRISANAANNIRIHFLQGI